MPSTQETIRHLNDRFRKGDITVKGQILVTQGVQHLIHEPGDEARIELFGIVRGYDSFDNGNDPHGEHDFGAFDFRGQRLFWKIDYYSPDLKSGSEDPSNPDQTVRVLTIMLASEY